MGIAWEINPICDDGVGAVLLLFTQQLADVRVICYILCGVLQPWPSEAMVGIDREVIAICVDGAGMVLLVFAQQLADVRVLCYILCGSPALFQCCPVIGMQQYPLLSLKKLIRGSHAIIR